jgi:hypothetical protein
MIDVSAKSTILWRLLTRLEVEIHLPDCIREDVLPCILEPLLLLSEEILMTLVPRTSNCKFIRMGECD